MKKIMFVAIAISSFMLFFLILNNDDCTCTGRGNSDTLVKDTLVKDSNHTKEKIKCNFYVEKSASMCGYFNNNVDSAKDILRNYYDRLDEKKDYIDTITLNFIAGKTVTQSPDVIKDYLNNISKNCNAGTSKMEEILDTIMSLTDSNTINILVSDFILDDNGTTLKRVESGITKIVTTNLERKLDLSIAIVKYDVDFKGVYFPPKGVSSKCNDNRPLYIWAFGPSEHIKKFVNLKTKHIKEGLFLLQPSIQIPPIFDTTDKSARMFGENNDINVSYWDKERHSDSFEITLYADFAECILSESDIIDIARYKISPSQYSIKSITHNEDNKYKFIISTTKPSPCNIKIQYSLNRPNWIDTCNYEGNNIPPQGHTYGIKYLIGGAFDAYDNQFDNLFEINLKLK